MKIAVIGTSGVGGYFGARLVYSGQDVTLIARSEHLEATKSNGLYLNSILGDVHVQNPRLSTSLFTTAFCRWKSGQESG